MIAVVDLTARSNIGLKRRPVVLRDLLQESQNGLSKRSGYEGEPVPVLRLSDVGGGVIDESDSRAINLTKKEIEKYALQRGDLVCIRVNGSRNLVGRVIPFTSDRLWAYCDHFIRLRPRHDLVDHRYLAQYLNTRKVRRYVELNMVSSAGQNTVSQGTMLELMVPLPDLAKQREIVAELEKQFSRLDEAVANLKRVKANLKRYKAAILKAAVEGRLVPTEAELARREGRSYETGTQLIDGVLAIRRTRLSGKGKCKEPAGPDLSYGFALPEGWTEASLDKLAGRITSGSRDWSQYYNRGNSFFVLAQNVRPISPDFSVRQSVDPPEEDPSRERSRIQSGDLLTTIVGANTGQVCLVKTAPDDAYVCQSVALIRPVISGIGPYLNYWLNSEEHGQRYFERCMYGQGRPHLSFEQLLATPIALPPLAEQLRIVSETDRRLSLVREVAAVVDANLKRAQVLRQAVLARAFQSGATSALPASTPASCAA